MSTLARKVARAAAPHGAVLLYDALTAIDLDRARLIQEAPADQLLDPEWVEHVLLPSLGLADSAFDVFPSELKPLLGTGLKPFQWPNQFAPYLTTLARYPISSYLEIGVFRGGTFVTTVEYLARFGPVEHAWAIDLDDVLALRRYARRRREVSMIPLDSADSEFAARVREWRPDLVLIDGDHAYEAARRDFDTVHGIANAIAFHDVVDNGCVGVQQIWSEVRDEHAGTYDFFEFIEQYPEVQERVGGTLLGIGLAVRKDFSPR